MGLDQYLYAKQYTSKYTSNADLNDRLMSISGASSWALSDFGSYVEVPAAYWRKQNAIHQWFVDNCQGGTDDCREAYVSREQLEELLSICAQIVADPSLAQQLLPTQSGFFFGSTDYDDWYFDGLRETVDRLRMLLNDVPHEWEFYYHSSW